MNWQEDDAATAFVEPTMEILPGKVALIRVPRLFTNPGLSDARPTAYLIALSNGLKTADATGVRGWIVDLRENNGGNMWPMLNGLGDLLGGGPFGVFVYNNGSRILWDRKDGAIVPGNRSRGMKATSLTRAGRPVAVLFGRRTASSGEMTTLALRGRHNLRTFGEPTAGLTTANTTRRLWDGALLIVTTARVAGRDGKIITGPLEPDAITTSEYALDSARDWLLTQDCPTQ